MVPAVFDCAGSLPQKDGIATSVEVVEEVHSIYFTIII